MKLKRILTVAIVAVMSLGLFGMNIANAAGTYSISCKNDAYGMQLGSDYTQIAYVYDANAAGTVTGAPKIRAMEIIDELEKSKRKMYAGSIGYFSANKNFDTCIALRTALIKNNIFYIQSGAGIVADSVPEKEYMETVNKAKALISSLS